MKKCTNCKTDKDESEFFKRSASKDGLARLCKTCSAAYKREKYQSSDPKERAKSSFRWKLEKKYGLTIDEFYALKTSCEICGSTERLKIDHDHADGKPHVRGVLCHSCNVGIGHFRDDTQLLQQAIYYLQTKKPEPN